MANVLHLMRPTHSKFLVLARATKLGNDLDMCSRMSAQLQWFDTIPAGLTPCKRCCGLVSGTFFHVTLKNPQQNSSMRTNTLPQPATQADLVSAGTRKDNLQTK